MGRSLRKQEILKGVGSRKNLSAVFHSGSSRLPMWLLPFISQPVRHLVSSHLMLQDKNPTLTVSSQNELTWKEKREGTGSFPLQERSRCISRVSPHWVEAGLTLFAPVFTSISPSLVIACRVGVGNRSKSLFAQPCHCTTNNNKTQKPSQEPQAC